MVRRDAISLGKKRVGRWAIEKDKLCLYLAEQHDGCFDVSISRGRIEMTPGVGSDMTAF
jgi:hypothetical protein